ncbi:MAG: HDOD domain-containing protein, partial [Actinomycetota bacterium]
MREAKLEAYIGGLIAFSIGSVALWIYWHGFVWDYRFAVAAVVLAGFVFLGDVCSIQVSERSSIGAWDIALIVAVAALGPVWAALAALPSAAFVGWRNPLRVVYEIGHSATIVFAAGVAFSFASEPLFIGSSSSLSTVFYATLVAGMVLVGVSEAVNGLLFKIKYGQSLNETWSEIVQPYLISDAINILTAGMSVLALIAYGPLAAIVVVAGSVGSQALVYRSREQVKEIASLRARVGSLEDALTNSNTTFGLMMIWDLGRKDGYTHHHAAATAVYAADIAREMKLEESRAERLRMAGLLHNIGMFSLPD